MQRNDPDATPDATLQHPVLVRPAAYARMRGLSKSTVSRQIRQLKIPVTGCLIDPEAADRGRLTNLDPDRKGRAEQRKALAGARRSRANSKADPSEVVRAGQRQVLDPLRTKAAALPRLLQELGAPAAAVAIAAEAFDSLFFAALGFDLIEALYGAKGPPPIDSRSNQQLAADIGLPWDESSQAAAADALLDRIDKFFEKRTEDGRF